MKVNKFVKENGIEKCKRILDDLTDQGHNGDFYKELKRLVESHELVQCYGGLDYARIDIFLHNTGSNYVSRDKLKQAIADVESC